jgi:hypothetical protein
MTLFLATIDSSKALDWAGMPHENEEIAVVSYTIADTIELLEARALYSGPTIIALQWLAQYRGSLQRQT